ncbi:MAG: hypothetical protein M3Y08_10720 [Fibrobacterota bacterium]|nr:hypothetical protein [Fibrobacterota bacterium]
MISCKFLSLLTLLLISLIGSTSFALPTQTVTLQGPLSWVTYARGAHFSYEKRQGEYSVIAKGSGYWWVREMSLLDSNDYQILGYGLNLSGRRYLSLKKPYYFEISGGYTAIDKRFTGESFDYFSAGGFLGRKFILGWFSIDLNFGLMLPSRSPKQLMESNDGAHPVFLPFYLFGEVSKVVIKTILPNSYGEANLLFGINF